jgi:hypothetical protein
MMAGSLHESNDWGTDNFAVFWFQKKKRKFDYKGWDK